MKNLFFYIFFVEEERKKSALINNHPIYIFFLFKVSCFSAVFLGQKKISRTQAQLKVSSLNG